MIKISEEIPTEKQKKTALFISNRMSISISSLVTKKDYWVFINQYFDKAKEIKPCECEPDEWDYEYAIPQQF